MALLSGQHTPARKHWACSHHSGWALSPPAEDGDGKLWVRTSVIIQGDANELYSMWHDIKSAPRWQESLKEVVKTGDRTSHWVMYKNDKTVEWDSEILAYEPGKRIAWRSTGGDLENAGEVIFEAAPTGRGTMVTLL